MVQRDSRRMHPPSTFCMLVGWFLGNKMECYMVNWPAKRTYRDLWVLNRTSDAWLPKCQCTAGALVVTSAAREAVEWPARTLGLTHLLYYAIIAEGDLCLYRGPCGS